MLNWVLVGIGDIARQRVIPAILEEPRSSLYGVVTRDPEKGKEFAGNVWTDLADALADAAVDAVYVATPVALHAPQSIAAMRAGKHVLCEKPVAMNHAEAVTMVEAAHETGQVFGVSYYRRLYPKLLRALELIKNGAIGRPLLAELHCGQWFYMNDHWRSWLLIPEMSGGGPLYDIASHRIDLLNYFFGKPVRACGQLSNLVSSDRVEDCATVLVEYENGVRGIVDARWNSHITRDSFRILGVDGEIDLTPLNEPTIVHPGGTEQIPCHKNLHFPCVQNFVNAVLDGEKLCSSGESAIWTDWVTTQVMSSGQSARKSYVSG